MPGIVGLISKMPSDRASSELRCMITSMCHAANWRAEQWQDAELGLYVGRVTLPTDHAACLPLENEDRTLALAISGEDFPDPALAQQLRQRGHAVSDEPLAHLVHQAEEDATFPACINGRFQGVLADRRKGAVTLFVDRYGMHRLYAHEAADGFYFASEAKALLAARPELRSIDPDGLAEFLSCGCTLHNRTLFSNIQLLPPAAAWSISKDGTLSKSSYFQSSDWEQQEELEPETYYEQLREVFAANLPRYFSGSEKVGISLTGGLDSRMILAWHKAVPGTLPCYSFGSTYRDSQDVIVARRVARACAQPHEVLHVGSEFLSRFAQYAERTVFLTDGCVDVRHAPDLYANELAAQIAPVRVTGNYGGEVLRRVRAFKPVAPRPGLYQQELLMGVERARQSYQQLIDVHPLTFAVFRQAPWHHYGLLSLEQSQLTMRSPFLDNDFVRTVFRAPQSSLSSDGISLRLIADGDAKLSAIRSDRGVGGSLPAWLANLQSRYLNFTFKAEYAYDLGMPKPVAQVDHALSWLHLERLFLGRHKFYHFRIWYRDQLAAYLRAILLDSRTLTRPYLQRETVIRLVEEHVRGDRNHTGPLHQLLTLELLHRQLIDTP